jgi:hypothetical protein
LAFAARFVSGSMTLVFACAAGAHAQDEADVQAAARAFQEGQRAQLRGDAADAARLYELADSIAPSREALRSAIRSRLAAGHTPRAATLALSAPVRYPADAESASLAQEVLAQVAGALARIAVHCAAPCAVLCDGRAVSTEAALQLEFFVEAGAHGIDVRFADQQAGDGIAPALRGGAMSVRETIDVIAGERRELRFAAPARLAAGAATSLPAPDSAPRVDGGAPASQVSDGLPTWVFLTAAGATAAVGGAALVSVLDTLDRRDAYRSNPTRSSYERGVDSQTRTNALLLSAGVLLAATTGLAFFTDWDGDESIAPSVAASSDGAVLTLRRSFR